MSETSTIIVREAKDEERPRIADVMLSAYSQYAETLAAIGRWEGYADELGRAPYAEGPFSRLVAVTQEGELVGSVQLFADSTVAYGSPELAIESPIIRYLAVSPSARGRGVATTLLQACIRAAQERGANALYLHTNDMMAAAIRIYERHGFRRAEDKDIRHGEVLIKSFVLDLEQGA